MRIHSVPVGIANAMKNMKHIGISGLVVGFIALTVAIFQDNLREAIGTPAKPDPTLLELARDAGKQLIADKFLKEEDQPSSKPSAPLDPVQASCTGLGLLAMILGVTSWIRKEHIRVSGGAISLGLVAIAWQYILLGMVIAAIIIVLANLQA